MWFIPKGWDCVLASLAVSDFSFFATIIPVWLGWPNRTVQGTRYGTIYPSQPQTLPGCTHMVHIWIHSENQIQLLLWSTCNGALKRVPLFPPTLTVGVYRLWASWSHFALYLEIVDLGMDGVGGTPLSPLNMHILVNCIPHPNPSFHAAPPLAPSHGIGFNVLQFLKYRNVPKISWFQIAFIYMV